MDLKFTSPLSGEKVAARPDEGASAIAEHRKTVN
jgi:hypothetical protein